MKYKHSFRCLASKTPVTSLCCWLHGGHQPSGWEDSTQIKTRAKHGVGATHQRLRTAAQTAEECYGSQQREVSPRVQYERLFTRQS